MVKDMKKINCGKLFENVEIPLILFYDAKSPNTREKTCKCHIKKRSILYHLQAHRNQCLEWDKNSSNVTLQVVKLNVTILVLVTTNETCGGAS